MPRSISSNPGRLSSRQPGQASDTVLAVTGLLVSALGQVITRGGRRLSAGRQSMNQLPALTGRPGQALGHITSQNTSGPGFRRQSLVITAGGDIQVYLTEVFDSLQAMWDAAPEAACAFLYVTREAFTPKDDLAQQFWSRANSLGPRRQAQFQPDEATVQDARISLERAMALPVPDSAKKRDVLSAELVLVGQVFGQILHGQRKISLDGRSTLDLAQFADEVSRLADDWQSIGNFKRQAYTRLIYSAILCLLGDINGTATEYTMAIALIARRAANKQLEALAMSQDRTAANEVVDSTITAKNSHGVQPHARTDA